MDREDAARARGGGGLQLRGIHQVGGGVDVHQPGRRANQNDSQDRWYRRVGHRDDLVPRLHADGLQGQDNRVGAIVHPDAIFRLAVAGKLLLEEADALPQS
jgi:hypothetical protein